MLARIKIGEEPYDALQVRSPPSSARAISRMEYVFGWHRHLVGKQRRRDWKIVCLLASGHAARRVAKVNHCSPRTVWDRRELQTTVIANGLRAEFGEGIFPDLAQSARTAHHRWL
jgi:hypothetical protein